jgi:AcrR family transcriptional regulator
MRLHTIISVGKPPGWRWASWDSEVAVTEPAKASSGPEERAAGFGRRADQLPSGRHGLLRSFVAANQRERILAAVTQAAAELGYAEMSVEAIIVRAGVSRRTFYEHFKNKEDAFLAAYDAVVHRTVTRVRRAYLNETTALERCWPPLPAASRAASWSWPATSGSIAR